MSADLTVSFAGDTSQLNAAVEQARQTIARFAPQTTNAAKSSLDALRDSLDRNTDALQSNSSGWRANLQAAANFIIVLGGVKRAIEEIASVEIKGDVILARSFASIEKADFTAAANSFQRLGALIDTVATTTGRAIDDSFIAARTAVLDFAVAHGLAMAGVAEQQGLVAVAAAGGMGAFRAEVELAASITRTRMAQMAADYQHLKRSFAERDPTSGREVGDQSGLGTGVAGLFADESGYTASGGAEVADNVMAGEMERAKASIKAAGDTLKDFITDLQEIPDTSHDAAVALQTAITTMPAYTLDANAAVVELLKSIATSGDEAKDFGDKIQKAFRDGKAGGADLAGMLDKVEDATQRVDLASRLGKSLQPQQAAAFFQAIQTGIDRQREGLQVIDADYEAQRSKLNMIGRLIDEHVGSTLKEHAARVDTITTLGEQSDILQQQVRIWTEIATKVKEAADFAAALKASSTPVAKIDDLGKRRDALAGRPQRLPNETGVTEAQLDLAARVAVLEAGGESDKGQEAVVDVMRNRLASGRFGSDLDAVLTKPKQFSAYSKDAVADVDTDSDAYNRAYEMVTRQFGPKPSADVTGGATSYLNPATATDRSWIDKMTNVTDIGNHRFGNVGDTPVHSDQVEQQRREALEATNKELREQQALEAGGTAEAKLSAQIAEENLTTAKDAVAQAEKMVAVRRQTLETVSKKPEEGGGTAQEQAAARQALVQAEQTLKDQVAARDRAREALATAQTQEGSRARLDATLAGLDRQQAGYAKDSAEYLNIEKQKLDATKAFNAQEAANAVSTENVRYQAVMKGLEQKRAALKDDGKLKDLSPEQEAAEFKAVADREEAENRAHFDRLRAIQRQFSTDSVAALRQTAQESAQAQLKIDADRVNSARAANDRIRQSYKETFDQIGSTVSSSIMGMIQGQTRFQGLLQNVAREMLQMFIQNRVRAVAEMAAEQASKLQLTLTGQAGQTSAVVTGEAARTAAAASGSAASAAAKAPAIIGSIGASANETYAGVFGFLSPIMGPLAAGPAAVAEALVMAKSALPSFAVGAWNLPSDMVAQVHAGEMIVPAGAAAAMRAAAGGGSMGGASMGDMHFHINGSKSPQETLGHIADNIRPVLRMLNQGWKTDRTLRPDF